MSDLRALSNTISFIEKHLCESFDLEDLTAVHGYSDVIFLDCFMQLQVPTEPVYLETSVAGSG